MTATPDIEDMLENERAKLRLNQASNSNSARVVPVGPLSIASGPKPLGSAAFHGVAGDLVKAIEPHTESDIAAILLQFLVAFGNAIGRSPYFLVGAARHYLNLFAALVGVSGKSRKGSSWSATVNVMRGCDEHWVNNCILSGLSSGEGLIWAVRDQIEIQEPIRDKKTKEVTNYQTVITDQGVSDKRLLVMESELASTLRVMERDGSTLSALIRQAFDEGNLRVLTKNSPAKATGAHISIVAHITQEELLKYLTSSESANGFGNRFLWGSVKRSKLLPDGGNFSKINWAPILRVLQSSLSAARAAGELRRDDTATEMWREVYPRLTADRAGLFGSVTARAEAQTLRLSCIYALLDGSPVVRKEHLLAALEVWRYCEDSARFIFGGSLGDSAADQILIALRASAVGLTKQEISEKVFGRNMRADQIERALAALQRLGLASVSMEQTAGRPRERWIAMAEGIGK